MSLFSAVDWWTPSTKYGPACRNSLKWSSKLAHFGPRMSVKIAPSAIIRFAWSFFVFSAIVIDPFACTVVEENITLLLNGGTKKGSRSPTPPPSTPDYLQLRQRRQHHGLKHHQCFHQRLHLSRHSAFLGFSRSR